MLLPQRARASGADVLHCASGTMPLCAGLPVVVTVHDVAWLHVQAHARSYARYYFGAFTIARYRAAARIAVDSEFSRGELLRVLHDYDPQRVAVIYPGVGEDFCNVERRGGDGETILVVGTIERRKNLEILIRALPLLPDARIVCVGPSTAYERECRELAAKLGVSDRIEFRGYVARAQLLELYATCAVLALPSRYEGFGYPAAQALCAGAPCVVSDRSALPEIVGTDAAVVAVDDLPAWHRALAAALRGESDERAAAARARAHARFGWSASARAMQDLYRSAAAS